MSTSKKYIPIDCNFYDRFEAAIVQNKVVLLEYFDEQGMPTSANTRLKDTLTKDGEEFLILPAGNKIRLDRIISLDGEQVPKNC